MKRIHILYKKYKIPLETKSIKKSIKKSKKNQNLKKKKKIHGINHVVDKFTVLL